MPGGCKPRSSPTHARPPGEPPTPPPAYPEPGQGLPGAPGRSVPVPTARPVATPRHDARCPRPPTPPGTHIHPRGCCRGSRTTGRHQQPRPDQGDRTDTDQPTRRATPTSPQDHHGFPHRHPRGDAAGQPGAVVRNGALARQVQYRGPRPGHAPDGDPRASGAGDQHPQRGR